MRLLVAGRAGGTIGKTRFASVRLLVVVAALCAGRAGGTIRDTSFDYGIAETASTQLDTGSRSSSSRGASSRRPS